MLIDLTLYILLTSQAIFLSVEGEQRVFYFESNSWVMLSLPRLEGPESVL